MSNIADQKEINRLNAEVEALRGEVARLDRMLDEYRNALNRASRWKSRAEIAEAQAAAMRAARDEVSRDA